MVSWSKRTIGTGAWRRTQTEGRGGQQSREGKKTVGRPGEACTVRAAPAAWLRAGRSPEGGPGHRRPAVGGPHGKNPPWGPHSKPHHPLAPDSQRVLYLVWPLIFLPPEWVGKIRTPGLWQDRASHRSLPPSRSGGGSEGEAASPPASFCPARCPHAGAGPAASPPRALRALAVTAPLGECPQRPP